MTEPLPHNAPQTVFEVFVKSPEVARAKVWFEANEKRIRIWLAILVCIMLIPITRKLFLATFVIGGLLLCPWSFYKVIPAPWRLRARNKLKKHPLVYEHFEKTQSFLDGVKPFFLCGLYLGSAPLFPLVWLGHSIARAFKIGEKLEALERPEGEHVIIHQNSSKRSDEVTPFYLSPAFAATTAGVFVLGLPAAATYFLYHFLGIDAVLGFPSHDPNFKIVFCVIGLYIASLSWCLMPLLLRAFFIFPFNFVSSQQDYYLTQDGIERKGMHGWFAAAMCFSLYSGYRTMIPWKDVTSVTSGVGGVGRLSPLPDTALSKNTPLYRVMNRLAEFTDAIVDKVGRRDYVSISSPSETIKFELDQLSTEDRARLFYAIRKWAPTLYLDERVQEVLVGSKVLNEQRYTQLWFGFLTDKAERRRTGNLEPGDSLHDGDLTIERKLDSGGQANVYLAGKDTGERVVIKEFILPCENELSSFIDSAQDFDNECSILTRISHPNIVRLLDFFTEDRRVYLLLEYVEGRSLRRLVSEDGPLAEEQVMSYTRQICEILCALHEADPPVVHRDLTPDNIILTADGQLKLIDFSVASGGSHPTTTECVGKHSYTPPEQFRGAATTQSDIYALGATLCYLLTGTDPVPITKSSPRDAGVKISHSLNQIIQTATELDVEQRYGSAQWLKLDLERAERGELLAVGEEAKVEA